MNKPEKYSILIIDDEKSNIIELADILDADYDILAVRDSREALNIAERKMPDVILLDIVMPEMDGHAVIAALKNSEKTKNIPVIFITGLSETDDEKKGLSLGAADYITKPFSSEIVRLRVQNQIKMQNQMRLLIEKELAEKNGHDRMEFLLNMNHEMLTPMNVIMGMVQIAKMEKHSEKTTDCLNEIDAASRDLLKLINDLLSSGNSAAASLPLNSLFSGNKPK